MAPDAITEQKNPVFFTKGMVAVIVGIVVLLVAIIVISMMQAGQGTVVPPAACGEKAIAYVNNNLGGATVELTSVTEDRGLYLLKGKYQSQTIILYMTKDCTLLFPNTVNMTAQQSPQATQQPTPAPVKSARPTVDLYVMSFCPYGTQAETVMSPVFDLLKSTADIRIRYITTITGSTVDSVDSLHGMPEAKEDLRQICINKYYPEKYWAYLKTFNDACYPRWNNATVLSSCRKDTAATLSIDNAKIETCAGGPEGLDLLRADETASARDRATASPTLVINGVRYSGARTPEAYKQAICNSFEIAPAECSTVLSSASTSLSTGGC